MTTTLHDFNGKLKEQITRNYSQQVRRFAEMEEPSEQTMFSFALPVNSNQQENVDLLPKQIQLPTFQNNNNQQVSKNDRSTKEKKNSEQVKEGVPRENMMKQSFYSVLNNKQHPLEEVEKEKERQQISQLDRVKSPKLQKFQTQVDESNDYQKIVFESKATQTLSPQQREKNSLERNSTLQARKGLFRKVKDNDGNSIKRQPTTENHRNPDKNDTLFFESLNRRGKSHFQKQSKQKQQYDLPQINLNQLPKINENLRYLLITNNKMRTISQNDQSAAEERNILKEGSFFIPIIPVKLNQSFIPQPFFEDNQQGRIQQPNQSFFQPPSPTSQYQQQEQLQSQQHPIFQPNNQWFGQLIVQDQTPKADSNTKSPNQKMKVNWSPTMENYSQSTNFQSPQKQKVTSPSQLRRKKQDKEFEKEAHQRGRNDAIQNRSVSPRIKQQMQKQRIHSSHDKQQYQEQQNPQIYIFQSTFFQPKANMNRNHHPNKRINNRNNLQSPTQDDAPQISNTINSIEFEQSPIQQFIKQPAFLNRPIKPNENNQPIFYQRKQAYFEQHDQINDKYMAEQTFNPNRHIEDPNSSNFFSSKQKQYIYGQEGKKSILQTLEEKRVKKQ